MFEKNSISFRSQFASSPPLHEVIALLFQLKGTSSALYFVASLALELSLLSKTTDEYPPPAVREKTFPLSFVSYSCPDSFFNLLKGEFLNPPLSAISVLRAHPNRRLFSSPPFFVRPPPPSSVIRPPWCVENFFYDSWLGAFRLFEAPPPFFGGFFRGP